MSNVHSLKSQDHQDWQNCTKCKSHDYQAGQLTRALFGKNEAVALICMGANALKNTKLLLAAYKDDDLRKVTTERDAGVMSSAIGKLLAGIDAPERRELIKGLMTVGIQLQVDYKCTHTPEEREGKDTPPPETI